MAQHISLLQQFLRVFRRSVLLRHLDFVELVQMLFVLFEAALAETEVIACHAIKSEFSAIDRFLATIASEPSLICTRGLFLLNLFIYLLFYRLG